MSVPLSCFFFFQCFLYTSIHIKLWESNFVTRGNIKTSESQVSCLRHLTQEKLDSDLANHKIGRWIVRKEKELNVLSGETWKVRAVVLAVYSLRIFSLFLKIILASFFSFLPGNIYILKLLLKHKRKLLSHIFW